MPLAESDAQLAARLAREAGRRLVGLRARLFEQGASSWDVKDLGDAVAQE